MKVRLLAASGVTLLLSSAVTMAAAAPAARGCAILTDPAGDASAGALGGPASAPPELDLREARITANARQFQVTIRVTPTSSTTPTPGENWEFSMSNGERTVIVVTTRGADGVAFSAYAGSDAGDPNQSATPQGSNAPYVGQISGSVDLSTGTIVMTAPLKLIGLHSPAATFTRFRMDSDEGVATSGAATAGTPLAPAGPGLNQGTYTGVDSVQRLIRWQLNQAC